MTNLLPFISFEGLDFSGKSTQIKLLTASLQNIGRDVMLIREPGGTVISEKIRSLLLDKNHMKMTDVCEVLLYSAARHQLVSEKIQPALKKGIFVIADRYVDSTTAYQGYGRQIPMPFIKQLNMIATEDLMPSITFYLDINMDTLNKRKKTSGAEIDRLESQKDLFYERIRKGYLKIADKKRSRIVILDGTFSVEQLKKEIWEFVSSNFSL
ncbi:MAG: dTMP kinase [Candidatus Heimdallarchaeota archaeon]|nr:dTMP kinase [Candidatus Heimdallarchaeota archaeon]